MFRRRDTVDDDVVDATLGICIWSNHHQAGVFCRWDAWNVMHNDVGDSEVAHDGLVPAYVDAVGRARLFPDSQSPRIADCAASSLLPRRLPQHGQRALAVSAR